MNDSINFIHTKQYKKFEEFCDSCKDYKYIGLCYGSPGVGKTLSANQYSNWKTVKSCYDSNLLYLINNPTPASLPEGILECDTIIITASTTHTPLRIENQISSNAAVLKFMKDAALEQKKNNIFYQRAENLNEVKLLIMDEADLLKYSSLEQLRNMYDRFEFGMVLIGMPGIERRFSRYPQLYSRIGFLHEFKSLSKDEISFIIEHYLNQLGTKICIDNFSDYETLNTILRFTKGNFRVLTRLFQQLERLMKINNISFINADLVNSAREVLVTGN